LNFVVVVVVVGVIYRYLYVFVSKLFALLLFFFLKKNLFLKKIAFVLV
jgi:hypothetical protein